MNITSSIPYPDNLIYDLYHYSQNTLMHISDTTRNIVKDRIANTQLLTDTQREILKRRYEQLKTLRVISGEMNIEEKSLKQQLTAIQDILRTGSESRKNMSERHQAESDNLPVKWAFGNKQFAEMMAEWDLDPEADLNKISRFSDVPGMFALKTDVPTIKETMTRHYEEQQLAIQNDAFLFDSLVYELANHEYPVTCDPTDAVYACGLSTEDVWSSSRVSRILSRAKRQVMKNAV